MWGTPTRYIIDLQEKRIIPTYVGNTGRSIDLHRHKPDHPHVCGEHYIAAALVLLASGSSPRMWGTRPFSSP